MYKIEVIGPVREIPFTDKETGERTSFRVQEAAFHTPGSKYPKVFEIAVPRGAQPYAAGFYDLAPDSVYVSRMGKLTLTPKLKPVAAPAAKQAAG